MTFFQSQMSLEEEDVCKNLGDYFVKKLIDPQDVTCGHEGYDPTLISKNKPILPSTYRAHKDGYKNHEEYIISTPDLDCTVPPCGLGEELFAAIKAHGDNIAQISVDKGEEMTYKELLSRSIRTAIKLKKLNVTSEDIVGMVSSNHLDICIPFLASQFLAVPFISWDPSEPAGRLSESFEQVPLKVLFVSPEYISKVEEALMKAKIKVEIIVFGKHEEYINYSRVIRECEGERDFQVTKVHNNKSTACIIFSSGTSGKPKGICLSNYALLAQPFYVRHHENIDEELLKIEHPRVSLPFKILSYIPLYWISTYATYINVFLYGSCLVVWSDFEAKDFLSIIVKYKIMNAFIGLCHAAQIIKVGRDQGLTITCPLRINIAGSIVPEKQILRLRELIPEADIYQSYGLTEVTGIATLFQTLNKEHRRLFKEKPKSCGLPIPGISYKVVDPETEEILGPNRPGELRLKTKMIMNGYYNADCSEAFDSDGWFKTGDLAYYDEDKCFYIVDRVKEMFIFEMYNVQPAIIEKELLSHPAVKFAVAIGIPHDEDGSHAMGIVVLENGESISSEELLKYANARLDYNHKLRAGIKIVDNIPTSKNGKIKRKELTDLVLEGKL